MIPELLPLEGPEEDLLEILSQAPFGIFSADLQGHCRYLNPEFLRITGLSASEAHGLSWDQASHLDDQVFLSLDLGGAQEFVIPDVARRIHRRDGTSVPVEIHEKKTSSGWILFLEDITLRQKMEEQLRINFAAMESATSMIMITDQKGIITWVNPAFTRGTGYGFAECLGKTPGFMSGGPDSSIREAILEIIVTGAPWTGEVVNRRKDGTEYLERETITPVMDPSGAISHFLAVKEDITELRANEQKLKEYSENLEGLVQARTRELEEAQKKILGQQRLEQDLEIAAQVQNSLMPKEAPQVPGFSLGASFIPARYISGDLYDFIPMPDGSLYILSADISGKGIPAALMASSARSTLRQLIQQNLGPAEVLDRANLILWPDLSTTEMFITLCLTRLDPALGLLTWANAGHTRGLVYRTGQEDLEIQGPTSIPLGIFSELQAREKRTYLGPGDFLLLYSDGITEAQNPEEELFGEEALKEILPELGPREAQGILDGVNFAVDAFCRGAPITDDRSMVLVKQGIPQERRTCALSRESWDNFMGYFLFTGQILGAQGLMELETVLSEFFANILKHGHGIDLGNPEDLRSVPLEFQWNPEPQGWALEIWEPGKALENFSPEGSPPDPADLQEGGYGLFIIQQWVSSFTYERLGEVNHWKLLKGVPE